jgi:uncharacterized protein (DUF433 family)
MSSAIANTKYEHINLDNAGNPIIAGTNMKVIELVLEKTAYGWSPEEIYFQHPYLTLGQIHSAFAYYYDHLQELDTDIEQRLRSVDKLRQAKEPSPLLRRLRLQGLA